MSTNCLVTKLKGNVDNNAVAKLGEGVIKNVLHQFAVRATSAFSCRTNGNYLSTTEGGPYTDHVSFDADGQPHNVYLSQTTDIYVDNWYNGVWDFWGLTGSLDLKYSKIASLQSSMLEDIGTLNTNIRTVEINIRKLIVSNKVHSIIKFQITASTYFDINPLTASDIVSRMPNLEKLDLAGLGGVSQNQFTGDFTELGKLTSLNVYGGNFFKDGTPSLEGFVAKARTAGRTTGTVNLRYIPSNVTFNGDVIPTITAYKALTWTADTITFDGVTINA